MAKENNKDRILKLLKECKNHQTAESIAVQLNIQRNTASGILNELVREGIVQKEKDTAGYIFLHTTRRSITRGSIYNIYWSRSKFKRRSRIDLKT